MIKIDLHIHTQKSILDAEFEFSQNKLDEYVAGAGLDCIAITNHNLFDKAQFEQIREQLKIVVLPGIEVDLEKCQILVISDGSDLDEFDLKCKQISSYCSEVGDSVNRNQFNLVFDNLDKYILIPHYDKKPSISSELLNSFSSHITAGEVSSPKKFMYCIKSTEKLVPLYLSDCRIDNKMETLPTRQTYLDCSNVTFSSIKECLRDKRKVALSERDGNKLFNIFQDGQKISTGLNVIVGERSSGKSHTLKKINEYFDNIHYIRQFALVARNEEEDKEKLNEYLSNQRGRYSKDYLENLQNVIENVIDIDIDEDHRSVSEYISSIKDFAKETEKHDAFSKAKLYNEDKFSELESKGLSELIGSAKNLVSNKEYKEIVNKHFSRDKLTALYLDLIKHYFVEEEMRLKRLWINDLIANIKGKLQLRSAAPKVTDVDFYNIALNARKLEKFSDVVEEARKPRTGSRRQVRGFEVVAKIGRFAGAGEMKSASSRNIAFSDAFKQYDRPYEFLQELKKLPSPIIPADYSKFFVKIEFRVLNKYGFDASGGEMSEFFLLDEIGKADQYDMLLIDEPESSFDNNFLNEDVNSIIKDISKQMPVLIVTHNNTVGVSIKPDYLICTRKEIKDGKVHWKIFSGYPTSKELAATDGSTVKTLDVFLGCMEAGPEAYGERGQTYENLKD